MTHAICIRCGAAKSGALTRCAQCQFEPAETRDRARSILLSDHHYSLFELDRIGEALRTGQPVVYDPEEILEIDGEIGGAIESLDPEDKVL